MNALRIIGVALAAAGLVAVVVALVAPDATRDQLGFGFQGIPDDLGEVLDILSANLRVMSGALAGAAILELMRSAGGGERFVRPILDVVVGLSLVLNAGIVGMAVGAYGDRMLLALLPHGPVEVTAFALAGAVYLRARGGAIDRRAAARTAVWAVGLLIVAAFMETYG